MADLLKAEKLHDGRQRKFYREDDKLVVTTQTDVSKLVERNKRAYNDAPTGFGKGAMHHVAELPKDVLEKACREAGCSWAEFMGVKSDRARKAWNLLLNDRDTRAFRTRPGRVEVKQR